MIWKDIKTLQKEGFNISSKKGAGYQLLAGYALNNGLIKSQLENTAIALHTFTKIDSTNTYLKKYISSHYLEAPLAVIAEQQTAGYGRFKRHFYSPFPGGLYLSLGIPLKDHFFKPSLLTPSIAVGVITVLEKYFPAKKFEVEWVNDILLNDKKVAGILTELNTDLESFSPSEVTIGIGINLTTQNFPLQLQQTACSISDHLPVDINQICAALINQICNIFKNYTTGKYIPLYKKRLTTLKHNVRLQVGQQTIEGCALDLTNDGGLIIQTKDDKIKTYYSGEVQKLRKYDQ